MYISTFPDLELVCSNLSHLDRRVVSTLYYYITSEQYNGRLPVVKSEDLRSDSYEVTKNIAFPAYYYTYKGDTVQDFYVIRDGDVRIVAAHEVHPDDLIVAFRLSGPDLTVYKLETPIRVYVYDISGEIRKIVNEWCVHYENNEF